MSRCDAIKIPVSFKRGTDAVGRLNSVLDIAESALEVDKGKDEHAYVRNQDAFLFATRDPQDTLLYPFGHAKECKSRYVWTDRGDGIELGVLKEDISAY